MLVSKAPRVGRFHHSLVLGKSLTGYDVVVKRGGGRRKGVKVSLRAFYAKWQPPKRHTACNIKERIIVTRGKGQRLFPGTGKRGDGVVLRAPGK